MGSELEMSNRILRNTAVKLQPVIKACTVCASEHTPRRASEHLIHSQRQEHATATHISQHHRYVLARWNHSLHNRACYKGLSNVSCALVQRCFHPDEISQFSCVIICRQISLELCDKFLVTVVKQMD